jgi:tetratricopeptide (TPR) repeat protein
VAADPDRKFEAEEERLRAAGRWRDLVELYEARAEHLDEPGREQLFYKAAEVASDQLDETELAERLFLRSFEVRGSYLPALMALKLLHTANKNTAGLLVALRHELRLTKDRARRAQLYLEIARRQADRDPMQALEAYYQAIEANPQSRLPLDELEPLARKHKQWHVLVEAYQKLIEATKKRRHAAVYYFLMGSILAEELGKQKAASAAFRAALDAGTPDPRILKAIGKHFERRKDWEGLAKALTARLELAKSDEERTRLRRRLAQAKAQKGG